MPAYLNVRDADKVCVFAPHAGPRFAAAYISPASFYHKQRVPVPSKDDLMRVRQSAPWRCRLRHGVNQRHGDADFADLAVMETEKQLQLRQLTQN
eukprot:192280-Pleurochrysis_carterae.AAC.1